MQVVVGIILQKTCPLDNVLHGSNTTVVEMVGGGMAEMTKLAETKEMNTTRGWGRTVSPFPSPKVDSDIYSPPGERLLL